MTDFKSFAISVCFSMVIGGIICIIRPSNSMQNSVKIIVAIFIISVFISPIINFNELPNFEKFSIIDEYGANTDLQDYINNEYVTEYKEQMAVKIGEILSVRGIKNYSVKFVLDDNQEFVCIDIYTKDKSDGLEKYLETNLGVEVNIIEEQI